MTDYQAVVTTTFCTYCLQPPGLPCRWMTPAKKGEIRSIPHSSRQATWIKAGQPRTTPEEQMVSELTTLLAGPTEEPT